MIVGTCVQIDQELNVTSPDSVKITITDPAGTVKADAQDMSDQGGNNWRYLFQSETTDTSGTYKAVVTAVKSGKTGRSKKTFVLEAA